MGHYFENKVEGIRFATPRIGKVSNSEGLQNIFLQLYFWSNNIPAKDSKPRFDRIFFISNLGHFFSFHQKKLSN